MAVLSLTPVAQANAGVFSFVASLFSNASAEEKEILTDANSQTASLLSVTPVVSQSSSVEERGSIVDNTALISDSGPLGTIADVEYLSPANQRIETYTVKKGDTLSEIADMYDVTVNTIVWANELGSRTIKEGQTLLILPVTGVRHKIKQGDTLQSIAKLYGGDVGEVMRYNDLSEKSKLIAGETIIIPDGEIKSVKTTVPISTKYVARGLPNYDSYFIKPAVNVRKTQGLHNYNAIDLAPLNHKEGTEPILAAASGIVKVARYNNGWNGGYGKLIVIDHPNGTQTLYAHCFTILVNEGQYVEQGQIIGVIGNTGKSTGPHLHFGIVGARNPF